MLFGQEVDTSILGIPQEVAAKFPYIASMGIYLFKKEVLLKLLRCPTPFSLHPRRSTPSLHSPGVQEKQEVGG